VTVEKLYAKYLLADRLNKLVDAAGLVVDMCQLGNSDKYGWTYDVHIQVGNPQHRESQGAEDAAARLLDAMPSLTLKRSSGLIYLTGTTYQGLTYRLYTGAGVCEMVQVGTRTVPAVPEREEPIYERRCPDPLNELAVTL
jgi:hypothetical protein